MRPPVHPREHPQQRRTAAVPDHRDVEHPVGRVGAGADPHPAAVGGAVADGHEGGLDLAHLAVVQPDAVRKGPERGQLGEHRQVVLQAPGGAAHAVAPVVDAGVEAGGEDGAEPAVADLSEVDVPDPLALEGVGDHAARRGRLTHGQAEGAGEVVAGADGDQAERGERARHGPQGEVGHAVTADGYQRSGARLDGGTRADEGVRGVLPEHRAHRETGRPQSGSGRLRRAGAPAAARGGVDEEGDLAGHATDPMSCPRIFRSRRHNR